MKKNTTRTRQTLVAIQGYEGSFHQEAAIRYFGKGVQVIPCASFRELVHKAEDTGMSNGGVMAIENSIAGSILPNYNLLHKSKLCITGELYLRIRQQLLVNRGVQAEEIREVHSHTMALQQCDEFLGRHPWKLVETEDTALSARNIARRHSRHIAAVASKLAATLYDLDVLAPNIHTLKNNYTRFLMLAPVAGAVVADGADKASVSFHTDHSRGSLARVLTTIAGEGINLSKLQSFPLPGSAFRYAFHADMEFGDPASFRQVMKRLPGLTESLKLYGVYKKGAWKG